MQRELEAAFRRTHYRVFVAGNELRLRVDRPEPVLAALLMATHAHGAALLTAFNPGGRRQAPFRNRRSQYRLGVELQRRGHSVFAGSNEDPRRLWPTEPALLVVNLSLERARHIAARYGQLAFLWMDASATPQLIETTPPTRLE